MILPQLENMLESAQRKITLERKHFEVAFDGVPVLMNSSAGALVDAMGSEAPPLQFPTVRRAL